MKQMKRKTFCLVFLVELFQLFWGDGFLQLKMNGSTWQVRLHHRNLTAGAPQNDGPWKMYLDPLKHSGKFWVSMLDFRGVKPPSVIFL